MSKPVGFLKETLKCIEPYLKIKNIVEIMINKPFEVIIEDNKGRFKTTTDNKLDVRTLHRLCHGIANYTQQDLSTDYPVLSTYIPQWGYRFQAVVGGNVESKISISIRLGNVRTFPLDSYFEKEVADLVGRFVKKGKNIVVSGGTSTGKTTCVNSLIQYIPKHLRIITLENMRELSVPHANRVHLTASESKKSQSYKLLSNSILRMRPDRIIIGELTTDMTEFYLRLSNTGHEGSLTTLHADSPIKALDAMLRNLLMAGATFDVSLMDYIATTVNYIIQLKRSESRKITAEIFKAGLKQDEKTGSVLFTAEPFTSEPAD
jgi:type IV secretion system protein VirB11